jgi:4-diphosphocytidyl-2-C-methyl-D-erythritol kinase
MIVRVLSPAKINLVLRVTGKRPDGYHNLLSLMCPVGLFDEIRLRHAPGPVTLRCSDPLLPRDETNLAFRAAQVFFGALGREQGVAIALEKRIPVAAGLGGGSSNAASVLIGLNHLHGSPFSRRKLMTLGRTLGADVPFFIFQSPALASGIGDILEPCPRLPRFHLLLVCPALTVATRAVYQNLNLRLTNCQKQLTKARLKKEAFDPARHLCNDLEMVTLTQHPELASIKRLLVRHGALGALMSGSGGSVFGLFQDADAARTAAASMPQEPGWRLFLADMLLDPVQLVQEQ